MDAKEYGFIILRHGFDVEPSLRCCLRENTLASTRQHVQHTTEPTWGSYNSPRGEGIYVWQSIPGDEPSSRQYHESRLLKSASTGGNVHAKTPDEFIKLEQMLRQRLLVEVGGKQTRLLDGFELSHVQATRMDPRTKIAKHKDKEIYGEIIATVNLQGHSILSVGDSTHELQPGDAYALFGQARAVKEHEVTFPANAPHERRFSLTFRFVPCSSVKISSQKRSGNLAKLQAGCVSTFSP